MIWRNHSKTGGKKKRGARFYYMQWSMYNMGFKNGYKYDDIFAPSTVVATTYKVILKVKSSF